MTERPAAVTSSLYIGNDAPFPHEIATDLETALAGIERGGTIVVPTHELAFAVLERLGADPSTAARQVDRAIYGTAGPVDPPAAPGLGGQQ